MNDGSQLEYGSSSHHQAHKRARALHEQASRLRNMPLEVPKSTRTRMLGHQLVRIDAVSLSPSSTLRCSSSDPGLWRFLQIQ